MQKLPVTLAPGIASIKILELWKNFASLILKNANNLIFTSFHVRWGIQSDRCWNAKTCAKKKKELKNNKAIVVLISVSKALKWFNQSINEPKFSTFIASYVFRKLCIIAATVSKFIWCHSFKIYLVWICSIYKKF